MNKIQNAFFVYFFMIQFNGQNFFKAAWACHLTQIDGESRGMRRHPMQKNYGSSGLSEKTKKRASPLQRNPLPLYQILPLLAGLQSLPVIWYGSIIGCIDHIIKTPAMCGCSRMRNPECRYCTCNFCTFMKSSPKISYLCIIIKYS